MRKSIFTIMTGIMLTLAITACGNNAQTAAGTAETAKETAAVTAAATAAAATEATTEAVTEAQTEAAAELDKAALTKKGIAVYAKDVDREILSELVQNFGIQEVYVGEQIDLSDFCNWNNLTMKMKQGIIARIAYNFTDDSTMYGDINNTCFINYMKSIKMTFDYKDEGALCLYYKHIG